MSENIDRVALGTRLKEIREYEGYSQEDIAKFLGLPRSAISLIESGDRRLDILELRKLAKLYKLSIDQLTGAEPVRTQKEESVEVVARATAALSPDDRSEVLRFVEFLRAKKGKR
jgi:transcriptional regulator with XRE-family HTH domain